MTDPRIIQLLARKLSGEATPEELAELDESLRRNPEAVYYAELLGQLWEENRSKPLTNTDRTYLKHLEKHQPVFASPAAGEESEPPRRRPSRLLVASLCTAFLLTGLLYLRSGLHKRPSSGNAGSNAEFVAQLGSRKTIVLPDGTNVRLNAGSSLRYDSDMLRKDTRMVSLSGEAFFDVANDKDRPFVIHTGRMVIRVLGTSFNVRAYPQDRITETTLLRGSVELTVNSRPYDKIILKPSEKFDLMDDTQEVSTAAAAAHPLRRETNKEKLVVQDVIPVEVADKEYVKEVSWIDDNFVFQNETLDELAPKMERWFNVTMEIENSAIRNFHFTGVFHKETIDQALSAMQLIKPFKFKIHNNHVLIN